MFLVPSPSRGDIQADINALGPNGGVVTIPAGVTTVSVTINLPDNVTLRGECANAVLRAANSLNGPVIRNVDQVGGNSRIQLIGFSVDGNKMNQFDGAGVALQNVSNVLIDDITVYDCYLSGVDITGPADDIRIESCRIHNNGIVIGHGIKVSGTSVRNVSITNNTIYGNHQSGINVTDSADVRMMGNYIYGHEAGASGASFTSTTGLLAAVNRVDGADDGGITVVESDRFVLAANEITGSSKGFDVRLSDDFVINGNIVRSNDIGISLNSHPTGTKGAVVTNNAVMYNSTGGLQATRVDHSLIVGNLMVDNADAAGETYGMLVRGADGDLSENLVINANNSIDTRESPNNHQKYGLRLEYVQDSVVSDNILRGANTANFSEGPEVTLSAVDNNMIVDAVPAQCSDVAGGMYQMAGDLNADCYVNLLDVAELTQSWLDCNDPENPGCSQTWPQP